MSHIGKNIKKIRTAKKLSQAKLAEIFDLNRGSVGAYEEGRAEPKIETIIQMANYFGLSIDILLSKELSTNELYHFNILNQKMDQAHHFKTEIKKADKVGGIHLVKEDYYIEYIVNYKSKDFINNLPSIQLPVNFKGNSRAFELNGSEMEYHQNGLHHGDILLCQHVDVLAEQLQEGAVYVIVDKEDITTKRLKQVGKKELIFACDDPNYQDKTFVVKEITELWVVKGAFSTYLNPPKMLEEKVMILENQIQDIQTKLAQLL